MKNPTDDCRGVLIELGPDALLAAVSDPVPFEHEPEPQAAPEHEAPPESQPQAEKPPSKLAKYRADHRGTLGMTWQEIEELRPRFIIDNFLRRGEMLLLGAESKSRKSWLAQDAGICVAAGLPWLADEYGANGFAVNKAKVWVFDLELSSTETLFRFAKARGNRWPSDQAAQESASEAFTTYSLDGLNVKDIDPLFEELRGMLSPGDLVIVDCFYRLVPDGNETTDVALAMEMLKRLASDTGAGVIVVDHFRKAGDDKARNRFAGSFVKQASASTLVAIETKPDDLLELSIDARTFHGCPRVHARFDLESYTFHRVPEADVSAAKDAATHAEAEGWLVAVWRNRSLTAGAGAADAGNKWGITRQAASTRLGKLVPRGFLTESDPGPGAAKSWHLTPNGAEIVRIALNLKP